MSAIIEVLETEVLSLPVTQRVHLIERLIASLDGDIDAESAWAAEVEQRNAEIANGSVVLLPGTEVLAQLRAGLQ